MQKSNHIRKKPLKKFKLKQKIYLEILINLHKYRIEIYQEFLIVLQYYLKADILRANRNRIKKQSKSRILVILFKDQQKAQPNKMVNPIKENNIQKNYSSLHLKAIKK